jgi:hypothetical protein
MTSYFPPMDRYTVHVQVCDDAPGDFVAYAACVDWPDDTPAAVAYAGTKSGAAHAALHLAMEVQS